jgi:hypothetical protein
VSPVGQVHFGIEQGREPSGVATYGVLGFIGHKRRSNTQRESTPSFSASFAIYNIFSLVADSPVCGNSIPAFTVYGRSYSIKGE